MRLLLFLFILWWIFPFFVLGVLVFMGKLKKTTAAGITGTAHKPFEIRAILHVAGRRQDGAAIRLMPHLPVYSPFITWAYSLFGLAFRWSGFNGGSLQYPPALPVTPRTFVSFRTHFIDQHLERAVSGDGPVQQVVFLGAGWDTRAWGLLDGSGARVFEVDMPATSAAKQASLEAAGLPLDRVTFVATDFVEKTWPQALTEAGFDPAQPTAFVLEGLVYYLPEDDVRATLGDIATMAPGSIAVFDYLSAEMLREEGPHAKLGVRFNKSMKKYYPNEPLRSGIATTPSARDAAASFLADAGLELSEWAALGTEDEAFGGMALAACPDRD